jgi:hypothetical protein
MGVRTRDVLHWRYGKSLCNGDAWVLAIPENSQLVAYSIFVRSDNCRYGLKRMTLADFQALNGEYWRIEPMLAYACARAKREKIDVIESLGFSEEKRAFIATYAPFSRQLESWRYFYKVANPELAAALNNASAWDPCCFDGDAFL